MIEGTNVIDWEGDWFGEDIEGKSRWECSFKIGILEIVWIALIQCIESNALDIHWKCLFLN